MALARRKLQTESLIRRPAVEDVAQEARRSQVVYVSQGTIGAGSHEKALMSRQSGADVAQNARRSQVGYGGREPQEHVVMSRKAAADAQEARRTYVGSGMQEPQTQVVMSGTAWVDVCASSQKQ